MTTRVTEQAIDWHLRRHDLDGAGWAAFVAWLEASPANAAAYDRIALLDAVPVPVGPLGANDNAPVRWRWWGAGAAVAAGLALLVGVGTMDKGGSAPRVIATRAGETRTLAFADGARVTVGGGSTVTIAAGGAVDVREGEALFHVRHDEARPVTVTAGSIAVRDVGTVFDVVRVGGRIEVQVAEGAVLFQPGAEAITLAGGDALTVNEAAGTVIRHRVTPASVGGWSRGSLRFEGVALTEVAQAMHRATGAQVTLRGDLPSRLFTGTITLTGAADRDIPHFAALIGAKWRKQGDEWLVGPDEVAAR